MGFKVGDMVIYKNQTVRVLKVGGIYLTLSGFGKVNTKKEQVNPSLAEGNGLENRQVVRGAWVRIPHLPLS